MKLIFCDINKSLTNKVNSVFLEFKDNKWDLELEAIHGYIFEINKQRGGKIVTASNPNFTFGGGLDALIKQNFPNEVIENKEFEITENIFKTVTVDNNLKSNKSIIKRALIGVFAYRKNNMILSGLGTSIGGLGEDEFIEVLREILSADLSSADLSSADLSYADLSSANLRSANLRSADLSSADLSYADLSSANLRSADLSSADLRCANLRSADLSYADLQKILLNEYTCFLSMQCPEEGSFIAWKKCVDNTLVKLEIPENAKRSSATSRKCRASKAKVLNIYNSDGIEINETISKHDISFIYKVGEIVEPTSEFDENRWNECGAGIHFFITKQEAKQY